MHYTKGGLNPGQDLDSSRLSLLPAREDIFSLPARKLTLNQQSSRPFFFLQALRECTVGIAVLEQKRREIYLELEEERQIQLAMVDSLKNKRYMLGVEKLFETVDATYAVTT